MSICSSTEVASRQLLPAVVESYDLAKTWLLANWPEKGPFQYLYGVGSAAISTRSWAASALR